MTDLILNYKTTRPDLRVYVEEMMDGCPDSNLKKFYDRSPVHFIKNIIGRLLIVHGVSDPNVHIEHVTLAKEVLDANKVEYEELLFNDEGHGIHKAKNRRVLFRKIAVFFREGVILI